jgi:hypothetical protein
MGLIPQQDGPPVSAFAVTPSDSVNLSKITKALWVGSTGDVTVMLANDTVPVLLKGAIGLVPGAFVRVYATGTTATNIVGLL